MKTRMTGWVITGAVCALAGCDDGQIGELPMGGDPVADGVAALAGRIDGDSGNQFQGMAALRSAGIAADSVVAITVDSVVIAEAAVRDGTFRLDGVPPVDGPLFIESRLGGVTTGRVLVPLGADGDELTVVMPISAETTVEAAIFAELHAMYGDGIDGIGLMTRITHEMAATAHFSGLAEASRAAGIAERAALAMHTGGEVTAELMAEVRAGAFERLAAALDRAQNEADEARAWVAFQAEAAQGLTVGARADAEAQADAAAAAGFALASGLEGQAGFDAAVNFAGAISAQAEQAVIVSQVTDEGQARVEGAFADYQAALDVADGAAEVQAAHDQLVEALGGVGGDARSLVALLSAEAGVAPGTVSEALAAAAQITVDTRAALSAGAEGGAAQLGEAYAGLRGDVQAMLSGRLGGLASPAFVDVLTEVVLTGAALPNPALVHDVAAGVGELGGEGEGEGGIDIEIGGVITAIIDGGAAAQAGAEALVRGVDAHIQGDGTRLVTIGADGVARVVAEGRIIADEARIELPEGVTFGETTAIEIIAAGEVVAAGLIPADAQPMDGEIFAVPALSAESTVEALLALQAAAEGQLDVAFIQRMVDDATATAALAEGQIDALGAALWTAQSTYIDALQASGRVVAEAGADASAELMQTLVARAEAGGDAAEAAQARFEAELDAAIEAATGAGVQARAEAMAQATAAFEASLAALTDGQSRLTEAAAGAQAQLHNAAATGAALHTELRAEGQARADALAEAIEAHAEAIRAAVDPAAVQAAGAALRASLVGEAESITADLIAGADLSVLGQATVEAAIAGIEQAERRLQAALSLSATLAGDGSLQVGESVAATVAAFADFEASVDLGARSMQQVRGFEGEAEIIASLWRVAGASFSDQ